MRQPPAVGLSSSRHGTATDRLPGGRLAAAAELAAAHSGTLTAAKAPGSGAVVTLTLPAA